MRKYFTWSRALSWPFLVYKATACNQKLIIMSLRFLHIFEGILGVNSKYCLLLINRLHYIRISSNRLHYIVILSKSFCFDNRTKNKLERFGISCADIWTKFHFDTTLSCKESKVQLLNCNEYLWWHHRFWSSCIHQIYKYLNILRRKHFFLKIYLLI